MEFFRKASLSRPEGEAGKTWPAIAMGFFVAFGGVLFGYDTGTISGILAMPYWQRLFSTGYMDSDGNPNITTSQESTIVSILSAGTFFGALSTALFSDYLGRRPGLIIACWVFNLGVILQTIATAIPMFIAGRFFAGFGVGMVSAMIPLYQSETAPKWIRGAIVGAYQWAITIGLLLAAIVNNATDVKKVALITPIFLTSAPQQPQSCAKFEEAAKQFTTGPEWEFAQKFADSFLDSWNQTLTDAKSAPAPTTYSAIAASPPAANNALAHQPRHHQQQRQQQQPPHRQGQPTAGAPLRVDLRVFIRLDAEAPARAHNDYAIRAHISRKLGVDPRKIPRVLQVRSGWAVLAADITTRDLLVQRQTEWAPDLGAATVETRQEWFTYLVSDYPRKLTDLYGNEADSDAAVDEEIEIQTGQKPVNIRPARHQPDNPLTKTLLVSFLEPVKKYWRLFSSRPARLIKKTDRPRQCNVCLDYHRSRTCHRLPLCKRCGKAAGHDSGDCTAPEQCANFADCPARPKKVHGVFRRLTKEQRDHIRVVGAETFRQRNVEAQRHAPDLQQNGPQQDSARSLERSSPRAPSPAASRAPSCIMVATTPEAEEEPEHPRPGSPRKRRIVLITLVNFYRQNDERDALDTLLQWLTPDRCLVAGDFNARYHTWQTGLTTNRGHEIASWASENGLGLLNTSDIPTNLHGNTIDLAFSNVPLAEANVKDHLATSSDHFTLSLTLLNVEPALTHLGKIRVTTDDELKRFVEIVKLGSTAIPVAASSPLELDKLASTLVSLLQSAAKAAGRPARKGARNAPRWTEECALAAAGYQAIRRLYPLRFNQEVQIAKRDFHRAFQPSPLQVDDVVYETQLDKANALRRATLERRTAEDDIQDPWIEVSPRKTIPFPQEISLEEAQDATLCTGNTSPGADNITVKLLTAVWHIIGTHICRLFKGCLAIGYHPKPFRAAKVVIIAKPGCRDLMTPRAWRPISLLSCLYKGLERNKAGPNISPDRPDPLWITDLLVLGWFSYADDIAILCAGDTVEETAAAALRSVEEMVCWGAANGVSFDPKKTEVMHFSQSKLGTTLAIRHGYFKKHPQAAMRWLGIWLDSNLSFRVHAEK
ncbi:hypothetical protein H9Q70_007000 [Fusarium xylarioides]|nr:hypothetical protein H9Q70_007000 [Fusarium xylarioides]